MDMCSTKTKGYVVSCGYMGWVASCNRYLLFATEGEYLEYIKEEEE